MSLLSLKEYASLLSYHDTLNPALWDNNNELLPDVEEKLKQVANAFIESLKMNEKLIKDVIFTGSSANYNWNSKLSDIDLHVVAEYDPDRKDAVGVATQDMFNVMRNQFNFTHKIKVNGVPVETYVQPTGAPITPNAGVYSLRSNKWLKMPKNEHIVYNEAAIHAKAKPLIDMIIDLVKSGTTDENAIKDLKSKIWGMRATGVQGIDGSEYSLENLAFKSIRNKGYLQRLLDLETRMQNKNLSL